MSTNLFDYFEEIPVGGAAPAPWTARAPRRPHEKFDVKLVPRTADWQDNPDALEALERIEREPWVDTVTHDRDGIQLRVADSWIETAGAALEAGGSAEVSLEDLASGERYAVQFWDANATKALHVGHLRNLAIGNALASALEQAGGRVERRSLISDAGRSMGEAMAGVKNSGRQSQSWPDADQKSDHFVGLCYADYVARSGLLTDTDQEIQEPEDSLSRELRMQNDAADELIKRMLSGERETLELWFKTRAWVISGQRKTLARLGVSFDRVFFESDFLEEGNELTERGLRDGLLRRREDGVVVYPTGLEDVEELPLVRADGLPTQHMRALVYWIAAPELEHMTSMQICGTEWVSHVTCRRKLMNELIQAGGSHMHPTHDIFNGMVANQKRALASSMGALLIDDLIESLEAQIDADPEMREVRRAHPTPERIAAQVALGYFLPYPVAPLIDFDPDRLLREGESIGWGMVRARAHQGVAAQKKYCSPVEDPDYRFAVVQSELYRRYLRLAVDRLDVRPMAHYLKHLSRWYLESERTEPVERVVHTLLDRKARGLGLEASP